LYVCKKKFIMYTRELSKKIKKQLSKREIIIVYGARQVGKTTLLKELLSANSEAMILNCEMPAVADVLESKNLSLVKALFENKIIIALDEAQKINNIGSILKLIYDELPQYKIIATGSSSFELSNKIIEPLTGRNIKFKLLPLSLTEIKEKNEWLWILNNLSNLLVFGMYPGIIDLLVSDKRTKLSELASDYLFQDILAYQNIKNPLIIRKLLKALALQIGSQVSVNELSNMLGVSRPKIENYLDLLEKNFVIFSLSTFSTNLRNEIKKSKKYYFYDTGIRNAIINNFNPIINRTDFGGLWENFCINERIKFNNIRTTKPNIYFWRTFDGAEIDLIEECDGNILAFEFKWQVKRQPKLPKSFSQKYGAKELRIISPSNLHEILN